MTRDEIQSEIRATMERCGVKTYIVAVDDDGNGNVLFVWKVTDGVVSVAEAIEKLVPQVEERSEHVGSCG